jgi:hypothetical protein
MIRILFVLIAVVLRLSVPLSAAEAPRVLAWDDAVAARKLALVSGASSIDITGMHPSKRTGPLRLKAGGPLMLRALDRPAGADGKPIERACAVPAAIAKPLLVLLPDDSHPTGLRVLVADDNPAGFRWGSYRFLNATSKNLVVQLEKKAVRVPQGWKPVDLDLGGEKRGFGARVALEETIETPVYTAIWEYDPEVRTLCFVVPGTDPRLGPVAFKAVPEDRITLQLEAEASKPGDGAAADAPR